VIPRPTLAALTPSTEEQCRLKDLAKCGEKGSGNKIMDKEKFYRDSI